MINSKVFLLLVGIPLFLFAEIELPAKARVNGDFVKVRSKGATDGDLVGILYKNMPVSVVERSEKRDSVGTTSGYWYKVTYKNVLGWTFETFLDFDLKGDTLDTYQSGLGMDWFYKRFDYSTWEMEQRVNITSFTLEEYRALITAVTGGSAYNAEYALYYSIYARPEDLKKKGDQPPFPYLKEKLYTKDFIDKLPDIRYPLQKYLPDSLKTKEE